MDHIPDQDNMEEKILENIALNQAMATLSEKEQKLISMRYFENKTQTEIAKDFGVSQVQISRLEKKILKKLKEGIGSL